MADLLLKDRDRSEVYDKLYVLAEKLLSRNKACSECPVGCGSSIIPSMDWCCSGCPHLKEDGCSVKALGCKLHLCPDEQDRQYTIGNLSALNRLRKLQLIARHYRIWLARANKSESLKFGHLDFWYVYYKQHEEAYAARKNS